MGVIDSFYDYFKELPPETLNEVVQCAEQMNGSTYPLRSENRRLFYCEDLLVAKGYLIEKEGNVIFSNPPVPLYKD